MSYIQRDLSPLVRGDDWVIKLTITSDGAVVDITGYTYWLTLKETADQLDPGAIQVSVTASGTDATNGIVYVKAPRAQTHDVEPRSYYYDIQQLDNTSDLMKTILIGKVTVVKDITRAVS